MAECICLFSDFDSLDFFLVECLEYSFFYISVLVFTASSVFFAGLMFLVSGIVGSGESRGMFSMNSSNACMSSVSAAMPVVWLLFSIVENVVVCVCNGDFFFSHICILSRCHGSGLGFRVF